MVTMERWICFGTECQVQLSRVQLSEVESIRIEKGEDEMGFE